MANAIVLDLGYLTLQEFREKTRYQVSLATIAAGLEIGEWSIYAINRGDRRLTPHHQRTLWLLWREIERQEAA